MKGPLKDKVWFRVLLHAVLWILLFSLPFILRQSYTNRISDRTKIDFTIFSIYSAFLYVVLFYVNAFLTIPKFLTRKFYWRFSLSQVLLLLIIMFLHGLYFKLFITEREYIISNFFLFNTFPYLFILAGSIAYRLIYDNQKADKLAQENIKENLKTELAFLRSQVSPHFMFNVLNNMVALARKQSDQLESSLIKLSSLMRYMLYETDEQMVELEKEIEYLQSYVDLQQQRFGKNVKIHTSFETNGESSFVEPMLLIPFVENAFKHGTGLVENAEICVKLRTENRKLIFEVKNKYKDCSTEIKDKTSGIGLNNVARRLNLLYPNEHVLDIQNHDNWFLVTLELKLH